MVVARNTGQQLALQMGWDGSGQGQGGHKDWVSSLSGSALQQYNSGLAAMGGNQRLDTPTNAGYTPAPSPNTGSPVNAGYTPAPSPSGVIPRNRGQEVALTMGWDGSGQGQGGHKDWVSSLTGDNLQRYNSALNPSGYTNNSVMVNSLLTPGSQEYINQQNAIIESMYANRTEADTAGWQAELNDISKLFGGLGAAQISRKGAGDSPLYKDTYNAATDFVPQSQRGKDWDLQFMELDQDYLNRFNAENGTAYTPADVEAMEKRAGELRYLLDGPQEMNLINQYAPYIVGAVGTAGLLSALSAPAAAAGGATSAGGLTAGEAALLSNVTGSLQAAGGSGLGATAAAAAGSGSVLAGLPLTAGLDGATSLAAATGLSAGEKALTGKVTEALVAAGGSGASELGVASSLSSILGVDLTSASGIVKSLGGVSGIIKTAADLYGGYQNYQAQGDVQDQLIAAQNQAGQLLQPYADRGSEYSELLDSLILDTPNYSSILDAEIASGDLGGTFTEQDFREDPGYEFRKEEGNRALMRSLSSMGMGQSGAAIKAAIEYNQGIADQAYNDAFDRNRTEESTRYNMLSDRNNTLLKLLTGQQNIGVDATGNLAGLLLGSGNINAMTTREKSNILTGLLSALT